MKYEKEKEGKKMNKASILYSSSQTIIGIQEGLLQNFNILIPLPYYIVLLKHYLDKINKGDDVDSFHTI